MTETALVYNESGYLTAQQVVAQANLIQQVMEKVMKRDVHFGVVPGCGTKPTLLKPGAEKILSTFRIAVNPQIEDLSTPDCIKYRVKAEGIAGDKTVGTGVGVCSSNEEKFKWRRAIGKEFSETPEDRRRKKWKKGAGGEYQEEQVRTSPDDLANTILKMAKKRALVDLCLTATAASDCFSQDLEDLPVEYIDETPAAEAAPAMPQRKAAPAPEPTPSINSEADDLEPPTVADEPKTIPSEFRLMAAKYDGVCRKCTKAIPKGSEIAYSTAKGAFHTTCLN